MTSSSTGFGFEQFSQATIDAIPAAVFLTTVPGGEIVRANRYASEWCRCDGSSPRRLSDLLRSIESGNQSGDVANDPIASALRDGGALVGAGGLLYTMSSPIAVAVSIEPLRDSDGRQHAALTLCYRNKNAIAANRRRMDLVLEGTRLGTWELNIESRVLTSSRVCKAHHGLGPDDDLQLESAVRPAIHAEYRDAFRAAIDRAIESGEPFETELPHQWPDRSEHTLYLSGRLIDRVTVAGISLDVTQRRLAEAALAESERRYRAIVDTANEGIWTLDGDGRVTFVNPRMMELTGWSAAEMVGRHKWDFAFGDDVPAMKELFEHRRRGLSEDVADVRFRHRDGHEVWTLMAGRPIRDDRGRFIGAVDLFTDITARKEAEEARREADRRFQAGAEALVEADRRKDEFLALLAHELRTPLAPIVIAVRALQLKGPASPDVKKLRQMIYRQTMQLSKLIDDLLDVARITSGKLQLNREVVDINAALPQAIEACEPLIQRHHHTVDVVMSPDAMYVDIDVGRMVQVVCNLLTNAAKYMDDGGRIELRVAAEEGMVVIAVRDHGFGIAPEMQMRVFERFVQVDASRTHSDGGLGLGLALVKAIIEMHGGTVTVHSEGIGRGSEFTIRLPMATAP